ncbi:motility-associated protein [Pseudomonas aeruginosa]|uniref:motility-associated protein n=1 Tax=Pseudomonas aeruginosa TaxID=287 RepID=UPI00106810E4|nr:motility-associated protein [Pseudomonas aeruginosa]TEF44280.1 flagellar motor protein [Pseudomonas aeruginosa]
MDVLSLVGIILAFVAIVGGNFLEGGHAGALLNGPAALIVIGGTLAAALLQTPVNVLKRGLGMLGWVFFPPREDLSGGIDRIVSWSMTARKEGLLGLESIADAEPDPYARKGLQLLVDGAEPEVIRSILEVDLFTQESRDLQAAKVFEVATIYGVGFANLLLLPIGNKLKTLVLRQSRYREMLLEGLLSIAEGENPRSIELKLQGFMD